MAKKAAPKRRSSKRSKAKPAPAPSRRATPEETTRRVEAIVHRMIKGDWATSLVPDYARKWSCSTQYVQKLADRASIRIETSTGRLRRKVQAAELELEAVTREARDAGQYNAAVRAIEARMRIAGAFSLHRPGRKDAPEERGPRGLPPELAALDPPPTYEEVDHFAAVEKVEDCEAAGCRVHQKAPPQPAPPMH